jgi:hypothetical protein
MADGPWHLRHRVAVDVAIAAGFALLAAVGVLGAFTVAVTLLISPAGVLTPANDTNVWAPCATLVATYGPFFYQQNRRTAFLVLAAFTLVICGPGSRRSPS